MKRVLETIVCIMLCGLLLSGCDGGGEIDIDDIPSSGGSDVPVPASIIGYKLVQYVERNDGKPSTIRPGRTISYSFIDAHTILGEGLHTLPTTSWSYTRRGTSATVELNYETGFSTEELTFTSATEGTYESHAQTINGTTGWHAGHFEITGLPTGDANANGVGDTDEPCLEDNTGKLTVYTSNPSPGAITVYIDGNHAGSLSHYFTGDGPDCGASGDGVITQVVEAGLHTIEASSSGRTWGPTSVDVDVCRCSRMELQ